MPNSTTRGVENSLCTAIACEPVNHEEIAKCIAAGCSVHNAEFFHRRLWQLSSEEYGILPGPSGEPFRFAKRQQGGQPATPMQLAVKINDVEVMRQLFNTGAVASDALCQQIARSLGTTELVNQVQKRTELQTKLEETETKLTVQTHEATVVRRENERLQKMITQMQERESQLQLDLSACKHDLHEITGFNVLADINNEHWVARSVPITNTTVHIHCANPSAARTERSVGSPRLEATHIDYCMQHCSTATRSLDYLVGYISKFRSGDIFSLEETTELVDNLIPYVDKWIPQVIPMSEPNSRASTPQPQQGSKQRTYTPTPPPPHFSTNKPTSTPPKRSPWHGALQSAKDRLYIDIQKECKLAVHTSFEMEQIVPKSDTDKTHLRQMADQLVQLMEQCSNPNPQGTTTGVEAFISDLQELTKVFAETDMTDKKAKQSCEYTFEMFQYMYHCKSINELLHAVNLKLDQLKAQLHEAKVEQKRREAMRNVAGVENIVTQQLSMQKECIALTREKIRLVHNHLQKMTHLANNTVDKEGQYVALWHAKSDAQYYNNLIRHCDKDCVAANDRLAYFRQQCKAERLVEVQRHEGFLQAIDENTQRQVIGWNNLESALVQLSKLKAERSQLVQKRVEECLTLQRKEALLDYVEKVVEDHLNRLEKLKQLAVALNKVHSQVVYMLANINSSIDTWYKQFIASIKTELTNLHRNMYIKCREWCLVMGDYTHKKKLLLQGVKSKLEHTRQLQERAMELFDDSAEDNLQVIAHLELQRDKLTIQVIPQLETDLKTTLLFFDDNIDDNSNNTDNLENGVKGLCTKQYLEVHGIPFVHPMEELSTLLTQKDAAENVHPHVLQATQQQQQGTSRHQQQHPPETKLDLHKTQLEIDDLQKALGATAERPGCHSAHSPKDDYLNTLPKAIRDTVLQNRMLQVHVQGSGAVPSKFLDPLTLEIITKAVTAGDGHSYDYYSITQWLEKKQCSPVTRQPMHRDDLKSNVVLQDQIDTWRGALLPSLLAKKEKGSENLSPG